jgi:hypothetical protein
MSTFAFEVQILSRDSALGTRGILKQTSPQLLGGGPELLAAIIPAYFGNPSPWFLEWSSEDPLSGVVADLEHLGAKKISSVGQGGVWELPENFIHDPSWKAVEFFNSIRERDRSLFGFTQAAYPKPVGPARDYQLRSRVDLGLSADPLRQENRFDEVVRSRHSSYEFSSALVDPIRLGRVMLEVFGERVATSRSFAASGGLSQFRILWLSSDIKNPAREWDHGTLSWKSCRLEHATQEALQSATFEQQAFVGCTHWLVFGIELKPLVSRYGTRAFRFACLNAGGMLQQVALSCASYGIDFRVMGGFDERMLSVLCELPESDWLIPALGGLGNRS